ncbi:MULTISPECIES: MarR family winged helix-turn-helix transcriptional regulator [Micrococcales]|nr:MarR family transcriptional regulator [Brevibacterium aurantiacum]PMQ19803.1 MarR family transcriptional regulator [Glutamicibacter arilaitensis]
MDSLMGAKHELLLDHAGQHDHGAHLVMALLRTAALIDRACAAKLSEFDLSEGRLTVLLAAAKHEAATPALLAEQVGISRAAITGLIDGLERQQLVRRIAHPTDRRSLTIEATDQGRAVLDSLSPIYGSWLQQVPAGIGPDEAAAAITVLSTIQHNLGRGTEHE